MQIEFLRSIFGDPPDGEVCTFGPSFARRYTLDERGLRMLQDPAEAPWLYCVSTVQAQEPLKARREDVRHAYVLPLDDIGTKAVGPKVDPSYVLETSEGNYQWGYLLEPFDVQRGYDYYDGCLVAMAEAGHNDPGVRAPNRMIKMPGARHDTKPFTSRLVSWHPERRWDLKALMKEFGVRPKRVKAAVAAEGEVKDLRDVRDPLYDFLTVRGHNDRFVFVDCPWSHLHTTRSGVSSTAYSPLDYSMKGRQFVCQHGHCQNRSVADLINWAVSQGFDASQIDGLVAAHNRIVRRVKSWT